MVTTDFPASFLPSVWYLPIFLTSEKKMYLGDTIPVAFAVGWA